MSKLSAENSFAPVCIWVPWGGGGETTLPSCKTALTSSL